MNTEQPRKLFTERFAEYENRVLEDARKHVKQPIREIERLQEENRKLKEEKERLLGRTKKQAYIIIFCFAGLITMGAVIWFGT